MHFLKFLPLLLFSLAARFWVSGADTSGWVPTFFVGAGAACIQMLYFWYNKIKFDYIALGSNFFLIYGTLAFIVAAVIQPAQDTIKLIFAPITLLGPASIFPFILFVGLITTLVSSAGFIQFPNNQKKSILPASLALLALVGLAFLTSLSLIKCYGTGIFFGIVIPFIAMLFGREFIRNYFMTKTFKNS